MKKLSFLFLFLSVVGFSQTVKNTPVFKFEKTTFNYGEVTKGSDGNRVFVFTNVGDAPLIVNDIKSSCGCTIPKKPLKPIMPGEKGEIKVHYDTNRIGSFQKNIRIFSNAKIPVFMLYIKGRIVKKTL